MQLYGISEIADLLMERRETVAQWHHRGRKLPERVHGLAAGPVWMEAVILPWVRQHQMEQAQHDPSAREIVVSLATEGGVPEDGRHSWLERLLLQSPPGALSRAAKGDALALHLLRVHAKLPCASFPPEGFSPKDHVVHSGDPVVNTPYFTISHVGNLAAQFNAYRTEFHASTSANGSIRYIPGPEEFMASTMEVWQRAAEYMNRYGWL